MTEGLNVLFGPMNLKVKQENRNGSHIVHVHFESNPAPSPENVTFVIERSGDCLEEDICQPLTVMAGSLLNNFNASALENKVSIPYCILITQHVFFIKTKFFQSTKFQNPELKNSQQKEQNIRNKPLKDTIKCTLLLLLYKRNLIFNLAITRETSKPTLFLERRECDGVPHRPGDHRPGGLDGGRQSDHQHWQRCRPEDHGEFYHDGVPTPNLTLSIF